MSSTANGIERHLATGETYQTALDGLHEAVFVKDLAHRWVACNDAFCNLFGATREKIIGYSDPDFFPPAEAQEFWRGDDIIFETRQPFVQDEQMTLSSGQTVHISTRKYPRFDPAGNLIGLVGIIIDYTEIHKRREQADQLLLALEERQHTIEQQRQLIEQVSVPVIQVWEHILLLPLIGTVDDNRAVRVIESSLEAIARTGAEVLVDRYHGRADGGHGGCGPPGPDDPGGAVAGVP
ncbi:MAG: PAS domain-containing protein [Chloroflexaceae bacterium]|nr:PAS domain-containing protein [Chloroflexaceae bacterium]